MKIVLGVILGTTLVLGTLMAALSFRSPEVFVSPNRQFRIEILGDRERPEIPFLSTDLKADIFIDDKKLDRTFIYPSDFFESSFNSVYHNLSWDSENVFGFHRDVEPKVATEVDSDSLTVTNKTDQTVGFLNIMFGGNRYLLLNLGGKSSQTIYSKHSMYQEYIDVGGVFSDGTKISDDGKNFSEVAKYKNRRLFRYCATVEGNSVLVNSVDLDGYASVGVNRDALKVSACGK
jgi:hypothetical protein